MRTERQTHERIEANKKRTVAIIYMLMCGQSQRANWFQVALGRSLQECGITDQGLWALTNLGIAAHPNTITTARRASASTHTQSVQSFIRDARNRKQMIAIFIDDFHNIHTMHRPDQKDQTQAVHMATLLVKIFPGVPAISNQDKGPPNSDEPADLDNLKKVLKKSMKYLSMSFVHVMPDWATAKYFDQETTRQRLLIHDYQHEEIREMRSMKGCKLVDILELPLKSYDAFLEALSHMMGNGLSEYLDEFCVPFIGDWPAQFYVRQIIYSNAENLPVQRKNIVPLLGPLHISLNARECVVMNFHSFFNISDSSRSVLSTDGTYTHDQSINGWYRFSGNAGTQMIDYEPLWQSGVYRCKALALGWLSGKHPNESEGKVSRTVCFSYNGNKCWHPTTIKVKNCGNFYVYWLKGRYRLPESRYMRYCGAGDTGESK
eukprot:Seg2086.2 transcript_id=Seg2086.2/GoldUCD/mRNA.D3Y31 product="Pancreatic secretory granule membrane major glycoprotein GP2" protein_id=Seg2086.2/GoldUCD/D3Y31